VNEAMALPKLTSEASLTSGRPMMLFPEQSLEMLISEKGSERKRDQKSLFQTLFKQPVNPDPKQCVTIHLHLFPPT